MLHFREWDIAEFSMAKYVALAGRDDPPFRAIPVFPSRTFRHSSFYVSPNARIAGPKDLAGRRVGIPEWAQTAGVYARGYLQHQCGVSPSDIRWVQAGVNQAGRKEKVQLALPAGVAVESVSDRSLTAMLLAGEIDAMISAREPDAFLAGDARIVRIWPDYRPVEEAYYRETRIFPVMHVVVIKSATLDRNPWIAMNLFKAFEESKARSLRGLADLTTSRLPIPWSQTAVIEAQRVFGEDCWPYGAEANEHTLGAFLQYCCEQGITERKLEVSELFPQEFTKSVRV